MTREDRYERAPDREPAPRLVRSSNDRVLAGVCGGFAAWSGVSPGVVRVVFVLAALGLLPALTPFAIIGYALALALPEAETRPGHVPLSIDWQPDSVRMAWRGPVAPWAMSWWRLLSGFAALTGVALAGMVAVALTLGGTEGLVGAMVLLAALGPVGLGGLAFAVVPRNYTLTLTPQALWVERPTQRPRRIELSQVEAIHPTPRGFAVHLVDGEHVVLAPLPDQPEADVVLEELYRSVERGRDHEATLEAADGERRRLERLARQADATSARGVHD